MVLKLRLERRQALPYVIYHAAWRIYRSGDLKDTSNDS